MIKLTPLPMKRAFHILGPEAIERDERQDLMEQPRHGFNRFFYLQGIMIAYVSIYLKHFTYI